MTEDVVPKEAPTEADAAPVSEAASAQALFMRAFGARGIRSHAGMGVKGES